MLSLRFIALLIQPASQLRLLVMKRQQEPSKKQSEATCLRNIGPYLLCSIPNQLDGFDSDRGSAGFYLMDIWTSRSCSDRYQQGRELQYDEEYNLLDTHVREVIRQEKVFLIYGFKI